MNRTEEAYAQYLELRKRAGRIQDWGFERYKLKLADKTYYTPDFFVIEKSMEMTMHEVKGWWREDARVKIKVAAEQFPQHQFVAVTKSREGWEYEWF